MSTRHAQADLSRLREAERDTSCAQEPIHTPGTIQPHGALLGIDPHRAMTVVAASRNVATMLAGVPAAAHILGRGAGTILGAAFAEVVRQRFHDGKLRGEAPWLSTL